MVEFLPQVDMLLLPRAQIGYIVLSASELCLVFPAKEVSIGIFRIFIALSNCGASSEYASLILRRPMNCLTARMTASVSFLAEG